MKAKEFFGTLASTIAYPFIQFRKKSPLISFISGRIVTMAVLLFLLGFALFGLMALAPGDIVDQMMTQQIMTSTESMHKSSGASSNPLS